MTGTNVKIVDVLQRRSEKNRGGGEGVRGGWKARKGKREEEEKGVGVEVEGKKRKQKRRKKKFLQWKGRGCVRELH
jgi:hypothetical protein